MERKHVVIVGAGFGGLRAARNLGHAPVRVTVIDRENHHLFQPLLYQVATANLSPNDIAVPIRSVLRHDRDEYVVLDEVVSVRLDEKKVELRDGPPMSYDYLILAPGTRTAYYGHDEWAQNAHGLKDIRDAIRIRERVLMAFELAEREIEAERRRRLLTFVVIGGGPTGVELAGAISELGRIVLAKDFRNVRPEDIRVLLVELADRLLGPFDARLSERAKTQLEELGVEVRLKAKVTDVDGHGVTLGDEYVEASTVCWATGVRPVSLTERVGSELNRRGQIVVAQDCSLPGHPEVFAIGDIAGFVPEGTTEPLPMLAPVAMQQGRLVAKNIRRDLDGKPRQQFKYRDKGIMATVGRSRAVAQTNHMRLSGFVAWLAWLVVHIWYLIGFRNRVLVLFNWFWAYVTFKRGARLITARYGSALLPEIGNADRESSIRAHAPPPLTVSQPR